MSSHDMSHCDGEGCKKKDTCHRQLQNLELIKKRMIGSYSFLSAEECIKGKHKSYWGRDAK